MTAASTLLDVSSVTLRFGGVVALNRASLTAGEGAIVGLVGANGAGKTTLLNCIAGRYHAESGSIKLGSDDVTRQSPRQAYLRGISRTFQNLGLFKTLTVRENLLLGEQTQHAGIVRAALWWPMTREEERGIRRSALQLAAELRLTNVLDAAVGDLPYGTQKKVELARAVARRPRLLLVDEPATGLNRSEARDLINFLRELNRRDGTTMIVVDHNVAMVAELVDTMVVMDQGTPIAEGAPADVMHDKRVVESYLGLEA